MIDFYNFRSEAKLNIVRRLAKVNAVEFPLEWGWLVYALGQDEKARDPLLARALDDGLRWINSDAAWESNRNLGAIGLLCAVLDRTGSQECVAINTRLINRIQALSEQEVDKFSRLNDPDIVFGIALSVGTHLPDDLRIWFQQHCLKSAAGRPRRMVMFWAAGIALGAKPDTSQLRVGDLQVSEILPTLWFFERHGRLLGRSDDLRELWDVLEVAKEGIVLEPLEDVGSNGRYIASNSDMAMLFEVLTRQTRAVDPRVLFDNFPLHDEIRRGCQSLFNNHEYVAAVFEASKIFIDAVKVKAHRPKDTKGHELDGVELMKTVFDLKKPILKFNSLASLTEKNEQKGLGLMAEGMVSAFRNPKGHDPKDKIQIDANDALEQLVTISYLMKRLDQSHP
jgi:uncharacterized protein (TIGR02391 family)